MGCLQVSVTTVRGVSEADNKMSSWIQRGVKGHSARDQEHGERMKQKTAQSETQVFGCTVPVDRTHQLEFFGQGKLSDGIWGEQVTKSWPSPPRYLLIRLGQGEPMTTTMAKNPEKWDENGLKYRMGDEPGGRPCVY